MTTNVVNHIYWSPVSYYVNGTRLRISPTDLRVEFENKLMPPGKAIITWHSVNSYQSTKVVPQLPILQVGQRYRIVAHLTSTPASTFIIRFTFYNLQGEEIKREEFYSLEHDFIVPDQMTSYTISIINTGLTRLQFKRLDICKSDLPREINNDIWFHRITSVSDKRVFNLILVKDSKQARYINLKLEKLVGNLPTGMANIGWQAQGELIQTVIDWVGQQKFKKLHLISTTPELDRVALKLKEKFPGSEAMITNSNDDLVAEADANWPFNPCFWYSSNLVEPDWDKIVAAMKAQWGEMKE